MLNDIFNEVLQHEGVVTIISDGGEGFHVVNTWNSYIRKDGDILYIPAAGMHSVEGDMKKNDELFLTIGSHDVTGLVGQGTGFHMKGHGNFLTEGPIFEEMKAQFPFLTRVLKVTVFDSQQKI